MKETFVAWQTQKTSPHRLHSEVPLAKNKQSSERIWSGKVFFFFLLEELKYSKAKKDLTAEFVCMELVLDVCIMFGSIVVRRKGIEVHHSKIVSSNS